MYAFLSGAIMLGCFAVSLVFLRSWQRTSDRLFAWFALSFAILGTERWVLAVVHVPEASSPLVYLLRLLAFSLIILAIVDKNRR